MNCLYLPILNSGTYWKTAFSEYSALTHLRRPPDEIAASCGLLAPVYGWFTEGFDTLDLKEAKALLEELA